MKKDERAIRMDGGKLVTQKVQRINKEEVSSFKKGLRVKGTWSTSHTGAGTDGYRGSGTIP